MKFIVISLLFVTLLFSIEKRIVLGSYTYEINAKNQLKLVEEYVSKNEKIKELIAINQVEVREENIGKYKVVSIGYYNNYVGLFRSIEELQKEYSDAYTLDKNSAKAVKSKESKSEVVKEVTLEEKVEDAKEEVLKKVDEPKVEVKPTPVVTKASTPTPFNTGKTRAAMQTKNEMPKVATPKPRPKKKELQDDIDEIYYYILGGLAAVILMILLVAMVIKNKVNNEGRGYREIDE